MQTVFGYFHKGQRTTGPKSAPSPVYIELCHETERCEAGMGFSMELWGTQDWSTGFKLWGTLSITTNYANYLNICTAYQKGNNGLFRFLPLFSYKHQETWQRWHTIYNIHKINLFYTILINSHTNFPHQEVTYKGYINLWIKYQTSDKSSFNRACILVS